MQSLTKYQEQFPIILKFIWKYERTQIVKTILRKNRINNSHPLTLEYTTKKQLSKGYGTGIKTDTCINGTG